MLNLFQYLFLKSIPKQVLDELISHGDMQTTSGFVCCRVGKKQIYKDETSM